LKILLTGAKGFTGHYFMAAAQAAGHQVIPLTVDLKDKAALKQEVEAITPEAVVHLAAISFVGHADVRAFYDVNVMGTLNLLGALADLSQKPVRVLLASSANVYGNTEKSPIMEEQPPAPVNHYAMSKLAMEHMARTYLDRLSLFFVRPFNYTGPGQAESFLIPKLVAHFARKSPVVELGNLDVAREFNDVAFVCEAYLRLLRCARPGDVYNICTGIPVTLHMVIELLKQLTTHDIEVKVNPQFVRNNEIKALYGSPSKLLGAVGEIIPVPLQSTLSNMLQYALQGGR